MYNLKKILFSSYFRCLVQRNQSWRCNNLSPDLSFPAQPLGLPGGHYGLGGQIIKNAKGHKKLRQRAQNSGKTQDKI